VIVGLFDPRADLGELGEVGRKEPAPGSTGSPRPAGGPSTSRRLQRSIPRLTWRPSTRSAPKPGLSDRFFSGAGLMSRKYPKAYFPDLYRNGQRPQVHVHRVITERALGYPLPPGAEVHHIDNDPRNTSPSNLVICQDKAYHKLLHIRSLALKESGHADWRKCQYCKRWDAPELLSIVVGRPDPRGRKTARTYIYHKECARKYRSKGGSSYAE
jgi:hypothetical protein